MGGSTEKRSSKKGSNPCLRVSKTDSIEKAHNKTKSAPRGQQHRLHLKRGQHTATETSLEVTTNDLTNEGTQKGSRMKPKEENSKTEGQKAKPMQKLKKTSPYSHLPWPYETKPSKTP